LYKCPLPFCWTQNRSKRRSTTRSILRADLSQNNLIYTHTYQPSITAAMAQTQANWKWCVKCACIFFGGDAVCHANNGVHDLSGSAMYAISYQAGAPGQDKWKWCKKCQVLSYTGNSVGPCQAGGQHDVSGSGNYHLSGTGGGQTPWKWCHKCQGLAWQAAACTAGGNHDFAGSGEYHICINGDPRAQASIGQDEWRWCKNCQLLCFDGKTSCAAGGSHVSVGSGNYAISFAQQAAHTQDKWKWCNKCYGLAFSESPSDGVCPRGGTHNFGGSGNYAVLLDVPAAAGQQDKWAWCRNCQQMWYSGNGSGRCASSANGGHTKDGSGAYVLTFA